MNLRLVLAGLVASLGLSVPGWSEVEGAFRSFQGWGMARLADWNARRTTHAEFIPVPDWARAATEIEAANDERAVEPSRAIDRSGKDGWRPVAASEPINASERDDIVALVLNCMADGQGVSDVVAVPCREAERPDAVIAGEGASFLDLDLGQAVSGGPIEHQLGLELARAVHQAVRCSQAEPAGPVELVGPPAPAVAAPVAGPLTVLPEIPADPFAPAEAVVVTTLPDIPAGPFAPAEAVVAPPVAPSLVALPEIPTDPFAPAEPVVVTALPEIPADPFAPAEAVPARGEAHPATVQTGAGDEGLSRALELTRAAARAWMTALAGQAAVSSTSLALASPKVEPLVVPAPAGGVSR